MNSQDGIQATEADIVIDNGINSSKTHEPNSTINIQIHGVMSMQTPIHEIFRGFGFVPVHVRVIVSIEYYQSFLKRDDHVNFRIEFIRFNVRQLNNVILLVWFIFTPPAQVI